MAIGTCTRCGGLYDFASEENANEPDATCRECYLKRLSNVMMLSDDSRMPFGKHKGSRLGDIPDAYWHWFLRQDWCDDWPDLVQYANNCCGE